MDQIRIAEPFKPAITDAPLYSPANLSTVWCKTPCEQLVWRDFFAQKKKKKTIAGNDARMNLRVKL